MNCPRCGTSNPDNRPNCVRCEAALLPAGEAETFAGVSLPPPGRAVSEAEPPEPVVSASASRMPTAGDWFVASVPEPDQVNFGPRYRIERMLGQGGMGAVYKAYDKELDRMVALKLIRPGLARDPNATQRFKQELLLASKISHKNILRIHDLGDASGVKFISMAYVDGMDLHTAMSRAGKLPLDRALNIIKQLCSALEAAHNEGVVHRDLKPENVLLDKAENVYVSDFGLAKSLEQDTGMTRSGEFLGTPRYMAPEQVEGKKIDNRTDIFALGLIIYEMMTGDVPFHADSTLQIMYKRVHEPAKSPKTLNPELPDWMARIIMKCLERKPELRYQNAGEILQDIERQRGSSRFSTQRLMVPQLEIPWMWLGVAVLLVAVIAGVWLWRAKPWGPKVPAHGGAVSVLVADFANYTGDPVFDGTLEPMVNVGLEGASFVNAFSRGTARDLARKLPNATGKLDEQSARLVALSQSISAVVTGGISRRGDSYSISALALDAATGNVIAKSEVTSDNKDEVLRAIPKLVAPIRQALGDTTPESVQLESAAGAFTAASLEAVHQFSVGMDEQFAGKFDDALKSYSKAAELDPNFARAYAGMSVMAGNLGKLQDSDKYIKLAMEHVDRITDRERFRVRGNYYVAAHNWQKCVEEYSELLKQYPADNIGYVNLAGCYIQLRNVPKAMEAAKRAVELAPKAALQRLVLSFYSSWGGDFAAGEREARTSLELSPSISAQLALAEAQMGQEQFSQAAETYQKLEKLNPLGASLAASGLSDMAVYAGRFSEAVRLLEQGAAADLTDKRTENAADKFGALAYVQLSRGDKRAAAAAAAKALATNQTVPLRFLAARTFVETGDTAKAEKLAAGLASELQAEPQAYAKLIEGNAALKRGNVRDAIKAITDANNLLDTWIGHFDLGRAYLQAGLFVEADSEFDRCIKRRGEVLELFMNDTTTYGYLPMVYYYQGRVREGLKSPGFKDSYRIYLGMRGQAGEDPLLAEIRQHGGL